ncbi:hypothetical protein MTR_3g013550 [Medicago truncatula]|uniref:Uncharacterized protein n=1 Tax=Medicago truncatula TaxID=3880 RepID=G7IVU5_MEDTR|nr:hypothetical protein MTR_3g013550 [Medicago truncatula]
MWSGVPSYRSTLDRLTYTNVELRPIPMVFGSSHSAFHTLKFTVDASCVFPLFSLLRLVLTSSSPFSTPSCPFGIKSVLKTIVPFRFNVPSELRMVLTLGLFYPGGGVVDSLPCTILGSAMKRLKESDLVVTQPSNNFGR